LVFIRWDKYFSAGVWSIGNELVFYVFFPFFVFFLKKFKPIMILLTFVLLSLYLYFAFVILNPEQPIREQWRDYINPLNQVFLFLGGFLIGVFLQNVKMKDSIVVLLVIVGLIAFTFIPSDEDAITIVTGVNRLLFTTCCFLICICFYKLTFQFPKFIHKPLTLLGENKLLSVSTPSNCLDSFRYYI
jgi:exopolysaccharide production protein ExoZ